MAHRNEPPREPSFLDMDPETMNRLAHRVVDEVLRHLTTMESEPAWRMISRGEGEARFREPVPETGRPLEDLLDRARHEILGNVGRIGHPRFLAFVPSAVTFPGVLGDVLVAGMNPFVGTWVGGSALTMLELVVVDWIRQMLGLPEGAGGLLTSGGSEATLLAVVTARDTHLTAGLDRAVIYASDQSHSCVPRAARIAGFPRERFRSLPAEVDGRLDPDRVRRAIREDAGRGLAPFLLVGNGGTTSTGSVDPLGELAAVAREAGLWFHVDAAYGGFAALTERGRAALAGMEAADSWVFDPHKWLYQGYECGSLLVREPRRLRETFRATADYLQDVDLGEREPNFGDAGLQLSRTSRALKVWLSVSHFGLAAFRAAVDRTLDLALAAERDLERDPRFEVLSPARLGVVCFRLHPPGAGAAALDALNRDVLVRLNRSGFAFLSSTRVAGAFALRMCVLSHRTTRADLRGVIERIADLGSGNRDGSGDS